MASTPTVSGNDRPGLNLGRTFRSRIDTPIRRALIALSGLILVIILFFLYTLYHEASPVFAQYGTLNFIFDNAWVPSKELYGAWPLVVGTIITSVLALLIGVPIAVASALFVTELCPRWARGTLTMLTDLLAAVPSVVYGLWGVFFLIPTIKPAEQWFSDTFAFLPFVGGAVAGPNYFVAALILAIMIIPIVSSISREVLNTVPQEHKEAALALGATRWEMIRMAVLPYSRAGITGASMLGLGRALGETIAVTLVIGNAARIGDSVFSQGYTLAAVIANEFGEAASDPIHRAALIAAGLVLFLVTLLINGAARAFVTRAERKQAGGVGVAEPKGAKEITAA